MKKKLVLSLKQLTNKRFFLLGLALFVVFILLAPVVATLTSQKGEEKQEKDLEIESLSVVNVPIEITSFDVKGVTLKSREKFSGSDEWLRDLKIKTKNTSGKTATFISFQILFPRPEEQKGIPPAVYHIFRGDKYNALMKTDSGYKVESNSDENQTSISLSQEELEGIFAFLSRLGSDVSYSGKIKKIQIQVEEVIFDDGTEWSFGSWYKINPKDLKNLVPIDRKGGAIKSTAFSSPESGCVSVSPSKTDCIRTGNFVCSVRRMLPVNGPNGPLTGNFEIIQGMDPCYIEDANGNQTSQTCGTSKLTDVSIPCATPTPTPTPTPPEECDWCSTQQICWGNGCISPVIIDVAGNGFNLTDAQGGVDFDITASDNLMRVAWSSANSDDAWLVLDRNGNGLIDDGAELFGTVTPQPLADVAPNGFLALAVYDKPENGGNNDGRIDSSDNIFTSLQLWQDANHNGVSESSELHSLLSKFIQAIDLDYKESKKTDQYGNSFRYRAKIYNSRGTKVGRWAWDVYPVAVH